MLKIAGFNAEAEEAIGDVHIQVGAVVVNAGDVGAGGGDDAGNFRELAGLIGKGDGDVGGTALHFKTTFDDAGEDGDVDVAAGDDAADVFAVDIGDFAGEDGGDGNGTGAFGDEFLLL